jgi:Zn-dependent peptidase ImmA (M78 family)
MADNILDTINPQELGQNLKQAREERGLRQEDAAEIINVARTTITAIEKGQRQIKIDELIELAHAYGRQISDLVRPHPKVLEFRVQYRGPVQVSMRDRETIAQAEAELWKLCQDYLELENILNTQLVRKYPPLYNIAGLRAEQAAEGIAIQERNRLGLGDGPLPILRHILEQDVGVRIFYLPLYPPQFSEMYYYDEQTGGCLAINSLHPEERRRWSLAHGYAHFLVHRYQPAAYIEGAYQREQFADYFAMFFLMPTSGLMRRYNDILQSKEKPTIADLCMLAHFYAVSLAALIRRLEGMNIAPRGTWERLRDSGFKVREAQKQLGLSPIPEQAQKLPMRYQYLAVEAFEKGLVSEGQFARFLRVDRLEARAVAQVLGTHPSDVTNDEVVDLDLEQNITTQ